MSNSCKPTPWIVARQAPLSMISWARTLELVAISFSRESSQPRDQTQVSYTAGSLLNYRQIFFFYQLNHLEKVIENKHKPFYVVGNKAHRPKPKD